jgi:hypothetical protein
MFVPFWYVVFHGARVAAKSGKKVLEGGGTAEGRRVARSRTREERRSGDDRERVKKEGKAQRSEKMKK